MGGQSAMGRISPEIENLLHVEVALLRGGDRESFTAQSLVSMNQPAWPRKVQRIGPVYCMKERVVQSVRDPKTTNGHDLGRSTSTVPATCLSDDEESDTECQKHHCT